jgi:elongation factor P|tara:strand:+ start:3646 stop:4200 length:555 start_codon:yes stop_codon:yes gene_type:complete
MKAGDLRPGNAIRMDGKVYVLHSIEHRTPGNLRAFVQIKIKDIIAGNLLEKRMNPAEDVEGVSLDRRTMEYLFSDSDGATFMDTGDFDQVILSKAVLGDALLYLAPNSTTTVLMLEGNPVLIELPASVELTIADTAPGIKGATATNQLKEATCDTGLKTRVPPFIEIGERIKVATADGSYISRV